MVTFTFTKRRQLIRLASMPFTSSRLATFGWVRYAVCNAWQWSIQQNLRRVDENSCPILSRLWTKIHDISNNVGNPSYFPTPLPDCLCYLSFRRYSLLSLEVVEKPRSFFGPQFFGEERPRPRFFYGSLLARFTECSCNRAYVNHFNVSASIFKANCYATCVLFCQRHTQNNHQKVKYYK